MRKALWIASGLLVSAFIIVVLWPEPADRGHSAFYSDRSYDFEAKRVLDDVAVAGGDTGEALQAIGEVPAGDAQGWYRAWLAAGDRAVAVASNTHAPLEQGHALLRAHTYYRTAEFFLSPQDPRRPEIWKKNVDALSW